MKHPNFCLFSGLFMVGRVRVDDKTPTAKTNGLDVTYGRDFVGSLNDKQLGFLILHENMHKAYRHLVVWKTLYKRNRWLANAACDYVINLQLTDYDPIGHDIEFPTDKDGNQIGLVDEKYRGMDAHQVFLKLLEEHGDVEPPDGGDGLDDHDWEGAESMDDKEKEEAAKEIEDALRQGQILVGKMKGNLSRDIQDLLTPKVDWKEALRDFIKSTTAGKDQTTWRRLHKRYIGLDIIMPSTFDERVGPITVAIDTSGSIGHEELAQFLTEVKLICEEVKPEKLDILYWDTEVAGHEVYSDAELSNVVDVTEAKGGGGTEPACVPKYMRKNNMTPECLIMLTDGYIGDQTNKDWSINSPVMWCIKGNSNFDSSSVVGKIVHVE
jgi:predicted metal-dependent peptidase